jgi:hypothetical protein
VGGLTGTEADRTIPRREIVTSLVAVVGVVAVPFAITWARGAIGIARNDDWSYHRIAQHFAEHGSFVLNGWPQMSLFGQAVLARPVIALFGPGMAPLQVMVAVLGVIGLWASYLLVRRFLAVVEAALAVGCLAVGPVYASLSSSFMTDVPSFALQALALLAGWRATRRREVSIPWFACTLLLGFVAFTIREYAVAAALAVCFVAAIRIRDSTQRKFRSLVAICVVWTLALVTFYVWRSSLPHSKPLGLHLSIQGLRGTLDVGWMALLTLSFFVVPALVVVSPSRLVLAVWRGPRVAGALVVASVLVLAATRHLGFVWNYFTPVASYPTLDLESMHPVFPSWLWTGFQMVALVGTVMIGLIAVLGLHAIRSSASSRGESSLGDASIGHVLVVVFVPITVFLSVAAVLITGAPFFDRYLIVLVPFVAALVLAAAHRRGLFVQPSWPIALVALAGLGIVGLVVVDATATFDGARWRLATEVEALGYPASAIDGGFEWFSYQQDDVFDERPPVPGTSWWVTQYGERPVCVVLHVLPPNGAVPDGRIIARSSTRTLMGARYDLLAVAGPDTCLGSGP